MSLEHPVSGTELLAGLDATTSATQPLAEQQMGAGKIEAHPAPRKAFDRLAVQALRLFAPAEQSARTGLEAESPVGAAEPHPLGEQSQRIDGHIVRSGSCARLDQFRERPRRACDRFRILEGAATAAEGIVISAEPIVQDQARDLHNVCSEPYGRVGQLSLRVVDQSSAFGFPPAVGRQHDLHLHRRLAARRRVVRFELTHECVRVRQLAPTHMNSGELRQGRRQRPKRARPPRQPDVSLDRGVFCVVLQQR